MSSFLRYSHSAYEAFGPSLDSLGGAQKFSSRAGFLSSRSGQRLARLFLDDETGQLRAADLALSRRLLLFSRRSHPNTPRHDFFRASSMGIMLSTLLLHRHFFVFFPFFLFPLAMATSMCIMTVSLFRRNVSAGRITCCLWCRPSSVASLFFPPSSAFLIQPKERIRAGCLTMTSYAQGTWRQAGGLFDTKRNRRGKRQPRVGRVGDGLGTE